MYHPDADDRGDPIHLITQRGFGQHGQDASGASGGPGSVGCGGHPPTVPGSASVPPVSNGNLWTPPDLCTNSRRARIEAGIKRWRSGGEDPRAGDDLR
jgi:hypothetical protein